MFFWYVRICIFWKLIQYTIHWDKIQILKKFPSGKISVTKNILFFFVNFNSSQIYFNSRFLYELKHKVCLSKNVCGIFHFWFCVVFIKAWRYSTKHEEQLRVLIAKIYWNWKAFDLIRASGIWMKPKTSHYQASSSKG